jgi:hypothetical protein
VAREYVLSEDVPPQILRVYDEPGLSWRDAKKNLRQWYLNQAAGVRGMRERDALVPQAQDDAEHQEELAFEVANS